MKKIYIKRHKHDAGKYIYKGYAAAWASKGYEVVLYDFLSEINDSNYYVMTGFSGGRPSDDKISLQNLHVIKNSIKSFVYTQPNSFPEPWGNHPNFKCHCADNVIDSLNSIDNCKLWTFADITEFHNKWKGVNRVLLGFDSINYKNLDNKDPIYDVCFVGGWANNGFNEKRKIMLEHFAELHNSGLKCGVFINKNLTHEQENQVLSNSKVALNIHDYYQRVLGEKYRDDNERTFKSLGLTGVLVCDKVAQVENEFPDLEFYETPKQMVELIKHYVEMPSDELEEVKKKNRELINNEHTYIKRVEQLMEL